MADCAHVSVIVEGKVFATRFMGHNGLEQRGYCKQCKAPVRRVSNYARFGPWTGLSWREMPVSIGELESQLATARAMLRTITRLPAGAPLNAAKAIAYSALGP